METCAGKRYITLSRKRGERKRWGGKQRLISNGTKNMEIERKRKIRENHSTFNLIISKSKPCISHVVVEKPQKPLLTVCDRTWLGLCLFSGFDFYIQLKIVQNHRLRICSQVIRFLSDVCHTSRASFSHICSSPFHSSISVFVSQRYSSCKVMQLQLASIWQGFFFCLRPALESYIHRANQFKR